MALKQNAPDWRPPRGRISIKPWQKALLFALILVGIWSKAYLDTQTEPVQYAWPAHFDHQGTTYFYRGQVVYSLPDGYELVGEVTDIGNVPEREDLQGNVDGYAYVDPENREDVYFRWKEWDESIDGKEPYLLFTTRTEFQGRPLS